MTSRIILIESHTNKFLLRNIMFRIISQGFLNSRSNGVAPSEKVMENLRISVDIFEEKFETDERFNLNLPNSMIGLQYRKKRK